MQAKLRAILSRHGRLTGSVETLKDNDDLFAAGLESLAIVNLMLAIEEEFDIEIPDKRLNRATFASLRAMATVIEALQRERSTA